MSLLAQLSADYLVIKNKLRVIMVNSGGTFYVFIKMLGIV